MKKRINKVIFFTVILSFLLIPSNTKAINENEYNQLDGDIYNTTPSATGKYSYNNYVIDEYNIDIKVNENNTLDIVENITVYFNQEKHGIYRTLPLKNKVKRLNGTNETNRVKITNLKVNNSYKTSRESNNYKIQIGSADKTVIGKQKYTISYNYNLGKDKVKDYDELYYNLIGTEWDTVIGNIKFTITMPKEFDSSKLGFSKGLEGSTNNELINYNVSGNTIAGNYNGILESNEAITVRLELPEGYFVNAGINIGITEYLIFILPIVFLLISILLWYKFGREDQVVETVEFYPPEGFNSLEIGFLYKGKAENKDITSLLVYLANKGYIEITNPKIELNSKKADVNTNKKMEELQNKITEERKNDPNSKKIKYYENMLDIYKNIDTPIDYDKYGLKYYGDKLNNRNSFLIKKLKDYDGTNLNEQYFMEGLFKYDKEEVTDKMLYNVFYLTNNKILYNINSEKNKNKIFNKNKKWNNILIILMIIATYCLITIPAIINYGSAETLMFALVFPGVGFSFMISMIASNNKTVYINNKLTNSKGVLNLFAIIWGLGFGGMPWLFMVFPALIEEPIYLISYIMGLISIIIMIVCIINMPKRNEYGNQILGKIKGFKRFLETAEKDKLEAMVEENPTYFYDILPYTYVLEISDKWIKKFETISMQSPHWYNSSNEFDMASFGSFINSTMTSAETSMSASPSSSSSGFSSSSSGGSSGGGSSGGGSGGGGGGSW